MEAKRLSQRRPPWVAVLLAALCVAPEGGALVGGRVPRGHGFEGFERGFGWDYDKKIQETSKKN